MIENNAIVKVGLGVIIEKESQILIGKRVGQHVPYYSIPGGHLESCEVIEKVKKIVQKDKYNSYLKIYA